jgi:ferritin-like metal-binding protein YciE
MEIDSLEKLFIEELKDLYSAEQQLMKALPKMAKACSNEKLSESFKEHAEQTKKQAERLEKIFEDLNVRGKGRKCVAMEGLIEEGQELMKESRDPEVLDCGLIGSAQKVEHYEIAGYGTVRTHANRLGLSKAAQLLQQTLDEEAATDKKLTMLAESTINVEAQHAVGKE